MATLLCGFKSCIGLIKEQDIIQWNLDITNLYIMKSSVYLFIPVIVKYIKKEPPYNKTSSSEQILLVSWPFLVSRFQCDLMQLCGYVDLVELHTHENTLLSWKQLQNTSLHHMYSKPSVWSICKLVHNIMLKSRRVATTYVGIFD